MKPSIPARIGSCFRSILIAPIETCRPILHLPLRLLEVVLALPSWWREWRKTKRQKVEDLHHHIEMDPDLAKAPFFSIRAPDDEGGTIIVRVPVMPHVWAQLGLERGTVVDNETGKRLVLRLLAIAKVEQMLDEIMASRPIQNSLHYRLPDSE